MVEWVDVGQPDQVKNALTHVEESFKRIDIVVNNAGITRDSMLLRMKEEEWEEAINKVFVY